MNEDEFVKKRYRFDRMIKNLGMIAVGTSCLFLVILLSCIVFKASSAFTSYEIKVDLVNTSISNEDEANKFLRQLIFPETNQLEFFSITAQEKIVNMAQKKAIWVLASAKLNNALANGEMDNFSIEARKVIAKLQENKLIQKKFNYDFFTSQESREPEVAGILTSFIGSMYTILVCLMVALPISVCAAIYLEEFAPKNILTTLVEVNINNLAAVPSIVFGLLGLAILINFFGFPRSAPITAGITLAMMIFPAMIITTRQALRTIPTSIKHAALALGATKTQIIMHHTLPLAIPGIMTGVILSIARAIGETAPLILIGMLAFIVDIPQSIFDPATVLPVQIFLWADSPEQAFQAKTSAAILVLLGILIFINMIAVYIRKKYEHRW